MSQKEIQVLFNANEQLITDAFLRYVIGEQKAAIQPHAVRSLLMHVPHLLVQDAFELGLYNFNSYTIPLLVTSMYLAKNFLQADEFMDNNQGSIALIGATGSGKSRLSQTLHKFFNGYLFTHLGKGIVEFQNYDVVYASFMRAEEVRLEELVNEQWKTMGDLTQSIKCRIKNQSDVQVKKNVPMVITSNGDLQKALLDKLDNVNYKAAHRRWGFVRYFESWHTAHVVEHRSDQLDCLTVFMANFQKLYKTSLENEGALMNSLIACALILNPVIFAYHNSIIQYYVHCIVSFARTLFGRMILKHFAYFRVKCTYMAKIFNSFDDHHCFKEGHDFANDFHSKMIIEIRKLLADGVPGYFDASKFFTPLYQNTVPDHVAVFDLTRQKFFRDALNKDAISIVKDFLSCNKYFCDIYGHILSNLIDMDETPEDEVMFMGLHQHADEECKISPEFCMDIRNPEEDEVFDLSHITNFLKQDRGSTSPVHMYTPYDKIFLPDSDHTRSFNFD